MGEELKKLLITDFNFDFINNEEIVSEASDKDLMRIRGFACHEGVNENDVEFTRFSLSESYRSLIDKPFVISPDKNGMPTGHAYDYKKKQFKNKDRIQIGHIVDAYPCIVDIKGDIHDVRYRDLTDESYPDGEYRIICDIVVYKRYFSEISEILARLHISKNLKFSMESICDYIITDDGVKHCTSIHFTGLTVVDSPAFLHSTSLEIAQKEDSNMDFEKLYNDEQAKVATLIAEKTTLENDKVSLETELVTSKEELAEVNGKLVEANAEITNLTVYKEKVETAEKLEVGKTRLEKLSKYGEVKQTENELAEISQTEYVELLTVAVENYTPVIASTEDGIIGLPNVGTKTKSKKDKLSALLEELSK